MESDVTDKRAFPLKSGGGGGGRGRAQQDPGRVLRHRDLRLRRRPDPHVLRLHVNKCLIGEFKDRNKFLVTYHISHFSQFLETRTPRGIRLVAWIGVGRNT